MLNRRRVVQGGLAAAGSLTVSAPFGARAQNKPPIKIRYNEVVRAILYAPAYVAITNGYFKDAALDVSLTTAQGGDKSIAALLSNSADIALIGPESAIYVQNSESPTKTPIFCGLTATDGFMLVSREKIDKFEWSMLKGKEILGFRPGSTPILFFEAAMRQNGIDPLKDVKLNNNVIPLAPAQHVRSPAVKKGRHRRFEEARKLKQSGPAAFGFSPQTEDRQETEEDDEYAALAEKYNVPFDDDEDDVDV